MEALSLLKFYAFGNRFQHLLQTKNLHGIPAYEIEAFLEDLDFFNLQVTKKACRDLEGLPRILKKDKSKRGGIGDEEWAIHIRKIMEKIRLTLESEMSLINVYIPTQKRYDVNRLLEDVASLFAPKVFEKLPELAQYDLDEAGKYFAFERPTAAAFHVLRATEGVLRHFYTSLTKRKKLPQEKQN